MPTKTSTKPLWRATRPPLPLAEVTAVGDEGRVLLCRHCPEAFTVAADAPTPDDCPNGHRPPGGIAFPADPAVIERLTAGEQIPMEERGEIIELAPGDESDQVPAVSLPWLLEGGLIEPVNAAAKRAVAMLAGVEPEDGGE